MVIARKCMLLMKTVLDYYIRIVVTYKLAKCKKMKEKLVKHNILVIAREC